MSGRNGRRIHGGRLVPSDPDVIALVAAVEERYLILTGKWLRVRGSMLPFPPSLDADVLRWRTMAVRHRRGDRRHTEAELNSVKAVAQWTVSKNAELCNQSDKAIQWPE